MSPNQLATNLRFLLWDNQIPFEQWGETLGQWLNCSERQALQILAGQAHPKPEQLLTLQSQLNLSEEVYLQLTEIDLCSQQIRNLREHNINYLIERVRNLSDQKQA